MKLFFKRTDGGPETNVIGYWLIEWKSIFSIALLRFSQGSRENFHSHAFNAISWILWGSIVEHKLSKHSGYIPPKAYSPSWRPIFTSRGNLHKVFGEASVTWALTFRGPWTKTWTELNPSSGETIILGAGRTIINTK